MNTRQQQLLNLVIENHIQTAQPIGSKFLVVEKLIDCGEATVRNELRVLEEEGYLTHPHTSAGRLPTAKGYRFFVDNAVWDKNKIDDKTRGVFNKILAGNKNNQALKDGAKILAELSNQTVLLAFSKDSLYYTGVSNLFNQPEVREVDMAVDLSAMFDHCEDCLRGFYDQVDDTPNFFIGEEHSFGEMLSIVSFRFGTDSQSLMALIGPLRMNYKRNYTLLNTMRELLK